MLVDYEAAVLSLDADGSLAHLNQFNASACNAIAECRSSVVTALNSLIDDMQRSPSEAHFKVYPRPRGNGSPPSRPADDEASGSASPRGVPAGGPASGDLYAGTRVFDLLQAALGAVDEERTDREADGDAAATRPDPILLEQGIQGDELEALQIVEIQVWVRVAMNRAWSCGVGGGMGMPRMDEVPAAVGWA